ncbi:MAG: hypothetical protein LH702_17165 [Phormidesmis sp. CAN_BIN44]|nr:hypothetical protein [Phormidesmis sp. CAN_BIN44]
MESSDQKSFPIESQTRLNSLIDPEILVGLAVVPVLMGMVGVRAIANGLQELGSLSEEIFRGDRLPVLDVSTSQTPESLSDKDLE